MRPETTELSQRLVLSAMSSIEAWERWAGIVPQGPAKTLNASLIRLTKGLIKGFRLFLIEESQTIEPSQQLSNVPLTMISDNASKTRFGYAGKGELLTELKSKKDYGSFNRPSL